MKSFNLGYGRDETILRASESMGVATMCDRFCEHTDDMVVSSLQPDAACAGIDFVVASISLCYSCKLSIGRAVFMLRATAA